MEEKETETKLTYEQLEQAAMQLQQRLMMVEGKLKSIDITSIRLTYLFKVIENRAAFTEKFIDKCTKEIEDILTIEEETPSTES